MESDFEALKKRLWDVYGKRGVLGKYFFNIEQLANQFYKLCQENNVDWRTIDLEAIIDPELTYSENLERLQSFFLQPQIEIEEEKYEFLKEQEELVSVAKYWACGLKPNSEKALKLAKILNLKPHPTCVLSKQHKKQISKAEAEKECIAEGKIHPSQKAKLFNYFTC